MVYIYIVFLGGGTLNIDRLRELKAAGDHTATWHLYQQLVAMRQTCAEACLIGGQAALWLGNLWASRDALESCLEREPDGAVLGMARFLLGEVMRRLGKTHEAIQYLTAFLDSLPEYQALRTVWVGPAYYNRGLAFRQANRLDESLRDYAAACEEFRREGLAIYLFMALQNLAWVGALFGDAVQVREALQEARPLCITPEQQWHHRLSEAFLAAIDVNPLDPDSRRLSQLKALELCQVIYNHTGEGVSVDVRSQAYWLAGRLSLEMGDVDAALHSGQQAMQQAVTIAHDDSRSLYDAADLLRQAHAVRSQVNRRGP